MSRAAIAVEGLGKRYVVGTRIGQQGTLAETISATAAFSLMRLRRLLTTERTCVRLAGEEFWAIRNVFFDLPHGGVLGIIGRNGSGKSTLLKILSRITPPSEGQATIIGRVGSLLEIGTGFHGELTGRENIFLSGAVLGMRQREIAQRFDEIVDFSGVERFIDTPVKHYSSGMYLRLAFAVAAHLRTEILLIDEVLAVGDAVFQKKCIDKMSDVAQRGRTVLFVSHNLGAVSRLCDSGLLLNAGSVVAHGPIGDVVAAYGRLNAGSSLARDPKRRDPIEVRGLQLWPPGSPIQSAAPLRFKFRLEVSKPFWSVFVQVGLMTQEGVSLLREAVSSEKYPELAKPGHYDVEVDVPPLWLRPQSYTSLVKVIAYPESGSTERYYSEWLDVTFEGERQANSYGGSVLAPESRWAIHETSTRAGD